MGSDLSDLVNFMSQFVTENRMDLINQVLNKRTRYLTVVLEDIFQSHNANAVLRSCDCFGIQDVHIIENRNEYKINPDVSLGSNQWLDLNFYNSEASNTAAALGTLKDRGYRIVATTVGHNHVPLKSFDISRGKCAFLFGTELTGLSDEAMTLADEHVTIPMYGFTESFNISVAVALILYELRTGLDASEADWELSEEEKMAIKLDWLRCTLKKPELIEKEFEKRYRS